MASVPSIPERASRRVTRVPVLLNVTSVVVLIAGILAFLIAFDVGGIRNTAEVNNPEPRNQPPQVPVTPKTVPMSRAAANIAIRFLNTAVPRTNLALSYTLVTREFRQGLSLKEWKTGNIPVPYFPIWNRGAGYSPYQVHWSYKNELMLKILLTPKKGQGLKAQEFWIGVKRANASAPWKVYYFQPYWYPPRLTAREDGG